VDILDAFPEDGFGGSSRSSDRSRRYAMAERRFDDIWQIAVPTG
jgi:hypothetical protein